MDQRTRRRGPEVDPSDERSEAAPAPPAPAQRVLALQRSLGNRETAEWLQAMREGSPDGARLARVPSIAPAAQRGISGRVLQRAPHRPAQGSTIRYQGQQWTVQLSAEGNPVIRIHRPPNHTQNLDWRTADFTILRQNSATDHDLRENDPGRAGGAYDAYGGLTYFERLSKVREKYKAAKTRALQMIKAKVQPSINQGSQDSLDAISLDDFKVTKMGPVLEGSAREEPAEWQMTWIEGLPAHPRRTWTLTIDADNPLAEKDQDPHVGWTVAATAGTQDAIQNTFGHVWLDFVPTMRTVD